MTQFIIFLIIGVAGIIVGYYLAVRRKVRKVNAHVARQQEAKEKNKRKILEYARGKEKITNDEIEKRLGVSDATTTRYFEELEKEGHLIQVGRTGRHTFYTAHKIL